MDTKDRFPLLRKILGTLGLPAEAIDDIIERIAYTGSRRRRSEGFRWTPVDMLAMRGCGLRGIQPQTTTR